MAIALLYLLCIRVTVFPLGGLGSGFVDELYHLILPGIVMCIGPLGFVTKITRASMLEQREADYVAFARAGGSRVTGSTAATCCATPSSRS